MTLYQGIEAAVGWIANIGQIVTIIFAILVVRRARQRFADILKGRRKDNPGGCHGVIIIAIGGGSIKGQVEHAVNQLKLENSKIDVLYSEEIIRHAHLTPTQQVAVLPDVLERKQQLTDLGVTHVYIFYKGPLALAMGVGALLDNWVPVTVFQFDAGTYIPILLLGEGAILNFRTELMVEAEKALLEQIMPKQNDSAGDSSTT